METYKTNQELANNYFSAVFKQSIFAYKTYFDIKTLIESSPVDLIQHYQANGNLKELKVKGIGRKTKRVLELILKEGVDNAREIIRKEKIKELQETETTENFIAYITSKESIRDEESRRLEEETD